MSRTLYLYSLVIISVISLAILALLNFNVNYLAYSFIISLIVLFLLSFFKQSKRISLPIVFNKKILIYLAIIVSVSNLILIYLDISSSPSVEILRTSLSLLITYFLPGWVLLFALNIDKNFNKLAIFIISFVVSIGISSIIYTIHLFISPDISPIALALIYFFVSVIPIIKNYFSNDRIIKSVTFKRTPYYLIDLIIVAWIISFFTYTILTLYPQMAFVPGQDIVRHYSVVSKLIDSPDIFHSEYPWFHISLASFKELSDSSITLFQTGIAFLSIAVIFAFHIMSKVYLYTINKSLHHIATLIFTIFSGLGWIYYIQTLYSFSEPVDAFRIFSLSYYATYFDIGVAQSTWLWLWFRPITVGFTIFFVLLYLMRVESINRLHYIIFSSFLLLILSLTHFSEYSFFILILFVLSIFTPKLNIRLEETIYSVFISLMLFASTSIGYSFIFGHDGITFRFEYWYILIALSLLTILLVKYPFRPNVHFRINPSMIISIGITLYTIALAYWIVNSDPLKDHIRDLVRDPALYYAVPSILYPELLGLMGLFTIPAIVIILSNYRKNPIIIFPIALISIIIISKIISFININYLALGYWERRLIPFIWVSISMISPLIIIKIMYFINNRLISRRSKVFNKLILVVFVAIIVFGGTLSTLLTIDYTALNISQNKFNSEEIQLQKELNKIDPHSTILTVSERSQRIIEYLNINYPIGYYKFQVWSSDSPELPLYIISGLNNPALIYIKQDDLESIIRNGYDDGFVYSHLMQVAPILNVSNMSDTIISIPRMSPPSSNSDLALVLPNKMDKSYYYAYDLLSSGHKNYTTVNLNDIPQLKKAKNIVVPTEELALDMKKFRDLYDLQFENILVLNINGYGTFTNIDDMPLRKIENNTNYSWLTESGPKNLRPDTNISKVFFPPLNLSEYTHFMINWLGKGTNTEHTIQFVSDLEQFFEYRFNDSWIGFKKLIFPMNIIYSNTNLNTNGIEVREIITGKPSWSSILRINIGDNKSSERENNYLYFDEFLYNIDNFHFDNITIFKELKSNMVTSELTNNTIKFPYSLGVYPIIHDRSYNAIANFDTGIPFLLKKVENGYNAYYLNIFPIVQNNIDDNNKRNSIYTYINNVSNLLDFNLQKSKTANESPSELTEKDIAAFERAILEGNTTISSPSSLIYLNNSQARINIDGLVHHLNNLTNIIPVISDDVIISSKNVSISGGNGFYSDIRLTEPTSINFTGKNVIISLIYNNNQQIFVEGEKITINIDQSKIISRQPNITSHGLSEFKKFYSYGELNKKVNVLGQDLKILGKIKLNIKYADNFTISENTNIEGSILFPKLTYYQNLESINIFKISDFYYIVIFILALSIYFIYLHKRRKKIRNANSNF